MFAKEIKDSGRSQRWFARQLPSKRSGKNHVSFTIFNQWITDKKSMPKDRQEQVKELLNIK